MATPISISNLTKRFPAVTAVNDFSLTVNPGELFFLLGPSGCGKSTLLRMIAGLTDPNTGSIRFADRDVTRLPPNKRNVGMVFQSYALWPHMTVAQNIAFGLKVRKIKKPQLTQQVRQALASVHMQDHANRKPSQLSGGQQQRVALARAMVIKPEVLLLDEPLSNLDAALRSELRAEIKRICTQAKITTIYVTHDQSEALSMADRIAVMRQGSIEQIDSPANLYNAPNSQFVANFLGETNLLPATVLDTHSNSITLQTAAGTLVSTNHHNPRNITKGQQVVCSIRPESISLANPGDTNTLQGIVTDSLFLGSTSHLSIKLASDTMLQMLTLAANAPAPGTSVTLALDPSRIVTLNE